MSLNERALTWAFQFIALPPGRYRKTALFLNSTEFYEIYIRDATAQEASAFSSVSGRAANQHFTCCSYLFNLAVLLMFSRKNNMTGLKKKVNAVKFFSLHTNMYKVLGCSHNFLALSLKTIKCLNIWELGFNYQNPPEVFLLFLLHYAKNMKKDQVFYEPTHKGIKYADTW